MIEPHVHIACAPRGAPLLCAAFWFAQGNHVYGWFTGARRDEYPASFFMLENYYSTRETVFYRSAQDDVRGDWLIVAADAESTLDQPPPLPPALGPELERMQDAFVREWLFYRGDAAPAQEADALRTRDLPARDVNLRPRKRSRLTPGTPAWTFTTPGADLNVVAYLGRRWQLDYAPQ
jgi:hypothetical protein